MTADNLPKDRTVFRNLQVVDNTEIGGSLHITGESTLDGVTQADLNELTGGGTTSLHSHAVHTQTATVTTDASTFVATHAFDLGDGPHVALVTMTILALDGDGETWGTDVGQIRIEQDVNTSIDATFQISFDGSHYVSRASMSVYEPEGITVGVIQYGILPAPRYLRVRAEVVDNTVSNVYSGSNHPTAGLQFDVSYT